MIKKYKYSPKKYEGMLGMPEELTSFYKLYEIYIEYKTPNNLFALEKQARDLFFTIKHRLLAGYITAADAHEMKTYIEDLLND